MLTFECSTNSYRYNTVVILSIIAEVYAIFEDISKYWYILYRNIAWKDCDINSYLIRSHAVANYWFKDIHWQNKISAGSR